MHCNKKRRMLPENSVPARMMMRALELAREAAAQGEIPVGAVLYSGEEIIAEAQNEVYRTQDPTAHAELLAVRRGCKALGTVHLEHCTLAVTLEPCAMCAQALAWARLGTLYFGAYDTKSGGTVNGARIFSQRSCHHAPEVYGGILEKESTVLLKNFFRARR